jgi:hypothetical protein
MKTIPFITLIISFILLSCKGPTGPEGPAGPAGSSGTDALIDPSVPLKVLWTYPTNGQVGPIKNLWNQFNVRFNKLINISTVNHAFQLSPSGSGYAYIDTNNIYVQSGDVVTVSFVYDTVLWDVGQVYTFTILTSLKDVNGNSLSVPYSSSFTPEPYFRVLYTYPKDGETNIATGYLIDLNFNNRLNIQSFLSSVSISPAVAGTWDYSGNMWITFYPSTQFQPNTVYVVTISTSCSDIKGNTLSAPYTFSFTTRLDGQIGG